jgi:single-strand DNA-binding protein
MNQISLIGRLTADPESFAGEKTEMASFRLAVQRRGDDAGAVFIDVKCFDGQARTVADHLAKGRKVAVTGRLEQDEWTTNEGDKRSKHQVIADQVEFLDAPKTASADEPEPAAKPAVGAYRRKAYSKA